MDECDWTGCAAPARLDVLLGQNLAAAERIGSFCIPHASLTSIDSQDQAGEPTWYDWHHREAEPSLVDGTGGEERGRVIPLFGSATRQRHLPPVARLWAETDVADP
jgi:hypothetical protein